MREREVGGEAREGARAEWGSGREGAKALFFLSIKAGGKPPDPRLSSGLAHGEERELLPE